MAKRTGIRVPTMPSVWDVRIAILGDTFYHELQRDGWEPFAMDFVTGPGQIVGGNPDKEIVVSMRKQVDTGSEPGNHTKDEWMYPTPRAD